jgi:hypothetical protein
MTQATTSASITTIPAAGLVDTAGNVVITALYVSGAGYKVMARRGGNLIASHLRTFETDALRLIEELKAEHAPATAEPAPVRLAPAAKGTQTEVTDPQHTALAVASVAGRVERGGKVGQASVRTLTALAKRGLLTLTYEQGRPDARKVVTGGVITSPGRTRLAQLTAADRGLAEYTARLAANLAFDAQPAKTPVAA